VQVRLEEADAGGVVGESSERAVGDPPAPSPLMTLVTVRGGEEALDTLARSLRLTRHED
jgi:hypothetical protein